MTQIAQRLLTLIAKHGWEDNFQEAIAQVTAQEIPALTKIRSFDDYIRFIDELVAWAPRECGDSRLVHDKLVEFYFVLDQPALISLQSSVGPDDSQAALSPLSQWIVEFADAWGDYLDTPESAANVDSFRTNPAFRWNDYMPAPSGYRTFNQFFARHVKPGYRPIAGAMTPAIVVAPADAVHLGTWPVSTTSTIEVKGLHWSIRQLLRGSAYGDRFANGVFTHCALRTFDYHRWHAPLAGTVVEARLIRGQAYLDVTAVEVDGHKRLTAVEGTGYQFVQMRGLVVLESAFGLVACLPVGMAQVSSVVITAEVGKTLQKGEEMGYFQFGGSDFVMVFEAACGVVLNGGVNLHQLQGSAIGRCSGR